MRHRSGMAWTSHGHEQHEKLRIGSCVAINVRLSVMGIEPRRQSDYSENCSVGIGTRGGLARAETVEYASRRFRIDGALIIEDIVDAALIAEARRVFGERILNTWTAAGTTMR